MALRPEQVVALRDRFDEIAAPMTDFLLKDAARRIAKAEQLAEKQLTRKPAHGAEKWRMTSTAEYQILRAAELGESKRAVKRFLKQELGVTQDEIERLFWRAAREAYDFPEKGKRFEDNAQMQQLVAAAVKQARCDFTNMTQTMGMVAPNGKALPLQKAYRKCMDYAFEQVFTGAVDYNTALRGAVRQLAERGVRVVDYESGVHTSLEAAARRNLLGGLGLMVQQIQRESHDALDCNGVEISAHANSAEDHEDIQGRQFSDEEFALLNASLARPIGTLNCFHTLRNIILGVHAPQYTQAELQTFKEDNARGVTYQGKHYTGYEATQMQRRLERAIRKNKRRCAVYEAAGDKEKLLCGQIKLGVQREEYRRFSAAAGLRTEDARTHVAGFGRGEAARAGKAYRAAGQASDITVNGVTLHSVTDAAIQNVQKPFFQSCSNRMNDQAQEYARKLLRHVKQAPVGTEATVSFAVDGKVSPRWMIGKTANQEVQVQTMDVPYIALHNHPSNGILSPEDVGALIFHDKMRAVGAVGNAGAFYTCEKVYGFRKSAAMSQFDRLMRMYNIKSTRGRIDFMQQFIQEAERYGLHFG